MTDIINDETQAAEKNKAEFVALVDGLLPQVRATANHFLTNCPQPISVALAFVLASAEIINVIGVQEGRTKEEILALIDILCKDMVIHADKSFTTSLVERDADKIEATPFKEVANG